MLQCIQSEVLHNLTGTVYTDANTVWGARKCLLIFVEKKNLFCLPTVSNGSLGESGSVFVFVFLIFISCEKYYKSAHFSPMGWFVHFTLFGFRVSFWLAITDFDDQIFKVQYKDFLKCDSGPTATLGLECLQNSAVPAGANL